MGQLYNLIFRKKLYSQFLDTKNLERRRMSWDRYLPLREAELREDGYITPPYVIDAHTHLHRHVPPAGHRPFRDFYEVSEQLVRNPSFINPEILIREMDRYGIDMAIVNCAAGMNVPYKELAKLISKYHDRLIGFVWVIGPEEDVTPEEAAERFDEALRMPEFKGVGEVPYAMLQPVMEPVMEVIAKHRAPILFHTGPAPYKHKLEITKETRKKLLKRGGFLRLSDPIYIDDIARLYPEIPFIIGHCGVQGCFYFGSFPDHALMVAAINENVYLETSMAPPEVIEKAVVDPAIGAEKLIFGSDFGATSGYYLYRGNIYPSYKKKPHPEQSGYHIKRALDVINQVPMPEEERRLILGQNIARLLRL